MLGLHLHSLVEILLGNRLVAQGLKLVCAHDGGIINAWVSYEVEMGNELVKIVMELVSDQVVAVSRLRKDN